MLPVTKEAKQGRAARAITGTVVTLGALAVLATRMIWPNLGIDAIAVALLVLAALPWLGAIFKSFNTPLGGAEYRDFKDQLQEVAEAAESARMIAEASEARDLARQDARIKPDSSSIVQLASMYDVVRGNMKSGTASTDEMTTIVGRMVVAYEAGAQIDVQQFLTDRTGGKRLAAYIRLYVKPEGAFLLPLIDAVSNEAQAFCQYWALRALSRIVDTDPEGMDLNTQRRLQRIANDLPANSDRRYQIGRILERF